MAQAPVFSQWSPMMKALVHVRRWHCFLFFPAIVVFAVGCKEKMVGDGAEIEFVRGPMPKDVIFCDIEVGRRCATEENRKSGIDIGADFDKTFERKVNVGLDFSFSSKKNCSGDPEAVIYGCPFPEGCPICIDRTIIGLAPGAVYEDVAEACQAFCSDDRGDSSTEACEKLARPSAGFPTYQENACLPSGVLDPEWDDPRD